MPEKENPWKGVCCARCYKALSEKKMCKCRCHGEHHGLGAKKTEKGDEHEDSDS